jgi:hypothetical protein
MNITIGLPLIRLKRSNQRLSHDSIIFIANSPAKTGELSTVDLAFKVP